VRLYLIKGKKKKKEERREREGEGIGGRTGRGGGKEPTE
jgi:hypothetical protein